MSSESTSYYLVQRNAELAESARQIALALAGECQEQFSNLCADAISLHDTYRAEGVTLAMPSAPTERRFDTSNRRGAEDFLAAWHKTLAVAEQELMRGRCKGESKRFLQGLTTGDRTDLARDVIESKTSSRASSQDSKRLATLETILQAAMVEPEDLQRFREQATQIGRAQGTAADAAVSALRQQIADATTKHLQKLADQTEAKALLVQLAGLEGRDIGVSRDALSDVAAGQQPWTPALRQQIDSARQRATAVADARWVAKLAAAKLQELGYQVETGFQTASPGAGSLRIQRPEWALPGGECAHDVQIDLAPGNDGNKSEIHCEVRHASIDGLPEQQLNTAIEKAWCQDFVRLLDALVANSVGIRVDKTSLVRPGMQPDRRSASGKAPRIRRAPRRRALDR